MPVLARSVSLQAGDPVFALTVEGNEFVQLGVVPFSDDAAGRQAGRGVLHQGPADQVLQFGQPVQVGRHLGHQGREFRGQ